MKLIFLTAALVVLASAHPNDEWFKFKQTYKKRYDLLEDIRRHIQFLETKLMVEEQNIKFRKGESTFSMGINHFADWYTDELKYLLAPSKTFTNPKGLPFKAPNGGTVRDSVNWVTSGAVSTVKDQKKCGCSYAFSAAGALEGLMAIKFKNMTDLSAQELVDCVATNKGCDGGSPQNCFSYLIKKKALDTEQSYPYQGVKQDCKAGQGKTGMICTHFMELKTEKTLELAVSALGPASVIFNVDIKSFLAYRSGIYDGKCSDKQSQALLAVGFGKDKETGKDYWLLKNSWSDDWGEKGYARVLKNVNKCHLADKSSIPAFTLT